MSQLAKAYALTDVNATKDLYDQWASTYDTEMSKEDQDYVGPALAATHVLEQLGGPQIPADAEILDAGCGTGLAGIALAGLGARKIDGVDLSPGMLDIARKAGVYRHLDTADLSAPLAVNDDRYDVVCCVGTLTQAHVGPIALDEFVRVVRPGGRVVATILGSIYESGGYRARIDELVAAGKVRLVSANLEDYRRKAQIQANMVVLHVL